jgi:hypothetical protein
VRELPLLRSAPIHELVRRWQNHTRPAIQPHAIPQQLRRGATREQLPVADNVRFLSAPARAHTDAATVRRAEAAMTAPESHARVDASAFAAAAPQINVDALTSQVIQQIDRRLIAYRERMGRV